MSISEADVSNTPEPEQQAAPDAVNLTDLQLLVQIVDLASTRGAFRGAELKQVGTVYDKVSQFLEYVASQQENAENSEGE